MQGGCKVLLVGEWPAQEHDDLDGQLVHFSVLFDGVPVAAHLVKRGVIRCYAPGQSLKYYL